MRVGLLYRDRDPELGTNAWEDQEELVRDLGLGTLVEAMGGDDEHLREIAGNTLLTRLETVADVEFRQDVVADSLAHPQVVRELYELSTRAADTRGRVRFGFMREHPASVLNYSRLLLRDLIGSLEELRSCSAEHAADFHSPGFRAFFATVDENLGQGYLEELRDHLRRLEFPTGVFMSATMDSACRGSGYVLRKPTASRRNWRDLLRFDRTPGVYTYRIPERDDSGARTLSRLKDTGLNRVANAAAEAADHIVDFFALMRWETGFYQGVVALHERLQTSGARTCFPRARAPGDAALRTRGLRDAGLALRSEGEIVGNDLDADGKTLVMITGANEGGKSTFLRSIGAAQIMMEAGLFVLAEQFEVSLSVSLHSHYRREEDRDMLSGKLDEEMARMSGIVDRLRPLSMVLFNESFACTNEREGAEIARTVVRALQGSGVRVVYVTHMFALADSLARDRRPTDTFLRAGRRADGSRTFKVVPGAPEPTSYGRDLYQEIFAGDDARADDGCDGETGH